MVLFKKLDKSDIYNPIRMWAIFRYIILSEPTAGLIMNAVQIMVGNFPCTHSWVGDARGGQVGAPGVA